MWSVENIYYYDSINIDQKSTTVFGVRSDKEISPLGVSKLRFHNNIASNANSCSWSNQPMKCQGSIDAGRNYILVVIITRFYL